MYIKKIDILPALTFVNSGHALRWDNAIYPLHTGARNRCGSLVATARCAEMFRSGSFSSKLSYSVFANFPLAPNKIMFPPIGD